MRAKVPQTMGACFELIENEYFKGPWVMGEQFTVCDPYLLTLTSWLERDGVDRARFPKSTTMPNGCWNGRGRVRRGMNTSLSIGLSINRS